MRGENFTAMFRTGCIRKYHERPASNRVAARKFWDEMAESGPIEWIMLIDGYWACQRPGDDLPEEHEAIHYRRAY